MDSNTYFLSYKNIMFGYFNKNHVLNGKRTIGIFFRCIKSYICTKGNKIKEKKIPNPLHLLIS